MAEHSQRVPLRELHAPAQTTAAAGSSTVQPGSRITLQFALSLPDGAEIDSNFDKAPVSCCIGDGSLLPGFERVLLGSLAGAEIDTIVPASQAFGEPNEDNVQRFPRYQFPPDLALTENLMVEFADARGYKQAGRVVNIGARDVEIDFNHPLAGRDIRFKAKIHQID